MSPLVINADQRDALYECFRERLTGIGDIELALNAGDEARAARLALEFSDLLRFALDDLGLGQAGREAFELRSPREVLERVLGLLRERAEAADRSETPAREEAECQHERNLLVSQTCGELLSEVQRCQ